MLGLMQPWPLLCHKILDHAARQHASQEVVSRSIEGPILRTSYGAIRARSLKVAHRLEQSGYKRGDRIATLAWNSARHLEAWYGIMGMGGVYHTLNPRLFPDQIAWIMKDAEDKLVFADLNLLPLLEGVAATVKSLRQIVVLTDRATLPDSSLANLTAYEEWLQESDGDFEWKMLDEDAAAGMCYTSGTTGRPKGVVYSHRSNTLHAMMTAMPDAMGLASCDTVLPIVPMFHANAWGLAQSCPMVGAKMVMPGDKMDGASLYQLLDEEQVTVSAAVPTVWLTLLQYLETTGKMLPHLKKVIIGGSACPLSIVRKLKQKYGVDVIHAWGMTETSPLGSLCTMKPGYATLDDEARLNIQQKQGHAPFGVEMKITDDHDRELPWDGKSFGKLKVRGPAVAGAYHGGVGAENFDQEGWFDTGDIAHIDALGYMQITDRAKDMIKSGGEWISSIELENLAMGHADVAEAAVIGVAHSRWTERPLLVVVPKPGSKPDKADILSWFRDKVAKWWIPDDVIFVEEIPHTAAGKIKKIALREQFQDYQLASDT